MNTLRLSLLDEACVLAGIHPPPLDKIIRILAEPLFDLHRSSQTGGRSFVLLLSRGLTDPFSITTSILEKEYHPVLNRFGQMIRRHAPHLSPEEFLWRFSFIIGAMHHTLVTLHQMTVLTRGVCRSDDYEGALARFTTHAVITFQAPPTSTSSR